jgi:hypothetical protein
MNGEVVVHWRFMPEPRGVERAIKKRHGRAACSGLQNTQVIRVTQ